MSFIAKNPLMLPEVPKPSVVPSLGTRGFFAGRDGMYEIDSYESIKKIATNKEILDSYKHYGNVGIFPTSSDLFSFFLNEDDMTATVSASVSDISGDVVIPYEHVVDGKAYAVTEIKEYGFSECSEITKVIIPSSVTQIGDNAFSNCSKLSNIIIPESVVSIGADAFSGCCEFTDIYYKGSQFMWSNITIGENSESLSYIIHYDYIPATKGDILEYLEPNDRIERLQYYGDANIVPSDENLFDFTPIDDKTASISLIKYINTELVIPYKYINDDDEKEYKITSINNSAFYECSNLTNVIIPNSVTSIGGSAFYGCSSLTKVIIPDSVTSINNRAFKFCSNLTNITIPDSVTSIGSFAFEGCSDLKNVTIGNSVTSIRNMAFDGCSEDLTIICNPGSTAETYAKENGIKYAYDYIDPTTISTNSSEELLIECEFEYNYESENFDLKSHSDIGYSEILEAFENGKTIKGRAVFENETTVLYPLVRKEGDTLSLYMSFEKYFARISIYSYDSEWGWSGLKQYLTSNDVTETISKYYSNEIPTSGAVIEYLKANVSDYIIETDSEHNITEPGVYLIGFKEEENNNPGMVMLDQAETFLIHTSIGDIFPDSNQNEDKSIRTTMSQMKFSCDNFGNKSGIQVRYFREANPFYSGFIDEDILGWSEWKYVEDFVENNSSGDSSVNIVDNLKSEDTDKALSANQGKILNETKEDVSKKIDDIHNWDSTEANGEYPSAIAVIEYVGARVTHLLDLHNAHEEFMNDLYISLDNLSNKHDALQAEVGDINIALESILTIQDSILGVSE